MAHANAVFLSLLSGAALVLALAPGCSNNNNTAPEVAIIWTVSPGTNSSATCGTVNDTFTLGSTTTSPIQTVSDGTNATTSIGGQSFTAPVSVQCTVAPNSGGFSVSVYVKYGNEATFTMSGQQINVTGS